jgi:hypothetical protein
LFCCRFCGRRSSCVVCMTCVLVVDLSCIIIFGCDQLQSSCGNFLFFELMLFWTSNFDLCFQEKIISVAYYNIRIRLASLQ